MKKVIHMLSLTIALATAVGVTAVFSSAAFASPTTTDTQNNGGYVGAVFAMSNQTAGNRIVSYGRASDGTLTKLGSDSTHGLGIGTDTDTQGPLRLSADHHYLYAANPGSDNITVFGVNGTHLKFLQIVYAGDEPLSLTLSSHWLYVLDGSVAGNGIRGFRVNDDGTLTELAHSFRALSSPIAVPGQVGFSPDGRTLLVTQKTANVRVPPPDAIDAFTVGPNGYASAKPIRNASSGIRPFSLAFRNDGKLVVAESFNATPMEAAASSYRLNANGTIAAISKSVANGQTDSCWIVVTPDQQYAFTSNFGTGTISRFRFNAAGGLTLSSGNAAFFGITTQPVDSGITPDGRYLYQLLRGVGGVATLRIGAGGQLSQMGVLVGGLPVNDGISGLAVY